MKISLNSLCTKEYKEMRKNKPHALPISPSASYVFDSINEGIDIFTNKKDGHVYARYGNPTCETVQNKLADMEAYGLDIEAFALLTNSGMSAINTIISAELNHGDVLLTQGNLYGGTTELFSKVLSRFGITPIFTDLNDSEKVYQIIDQNPRIKMIYFETPANPSLSSISLKKMSEIAKSKQLLTVVDNTFQTPYLQQPFAYGIDYVIHSTTKFLNGHGNSISGCIIGRDMSNKKKVWDTFKLIGSNCSPFDAWLLYNGLKTLAIRMDKHCQNALALANFLLDHPRVEAVNYPGLKSCPTHDIASSQMKQYGGMLSFEAQGGIEKSIAVMNKLNLAVLAPTLGDVNTLVLHPATSSHLNVDKKLRLENGITDGLIRVSVGIEGIDDLIRDFDQALA